MLRSRRVDHAHLVRTLVEIGAWCGKSTVYLGAACEATGSVLFSIDHHHGSEENQAGWDHHDLEVVDTRTGKIDTLPFWRRTIVDANLGASVVGLVGDSPTIASHLEHPGGSVLHRRWARIRTGMGGLQGLGAQGRHRRSARHP